MRSGFLVLLILLSSLARAGEVTPNGVQCPEVDSLIAAQLKAAGKRDRAALEAIEAPKSVDEAACIPSLQRISAALSMSLPSLQSAAISALINKALDAACSALDSAISGAVNKLSAGFEFPYGLGGVSIGVNTQRQKLVNDCIRAGGNPAACQQAYIRNEVSSIDMNQVISRQTDQLINQAFSRFANAQKQRFLNGVRPYTGVNRDVSTKLNRQLREHTNKVIAGAENVF